MIVKMKFLSITGPKSDIDRVVEQYLSKYEIHLENALAELKTIRSLTPFFQINPYKEDLRKAQELLERLPEDLREEGESVSVEEALLAIRTAEQLLTQLKAERERLLADRKHYQELSDVVAPFQDLPCALSTLFDFHFIRIRFGRIPREYFVQFETYISNDPDSVYYRCHSDSEYVWGIYFTPVQRRKKTDAAYASMHFERVYAPNELQQTPEEEYHHYQEQLRETDRLLSVCDEKVSELLKIHARALVGAYRTLESHSENFDIRKLSACTRAKSETFYIICGWMSCDDAASFQKEIAEDANIFCLIEDNESHISSSPPTKLKNPKFFQPFEMFVRMYGLPGYGEFDPTIYLALTYCFIFGIMFGDAGQGLCLLLGGFFLYKWKGIPLAAIMGTAGIFSTLWGLVYNSFFGFEGFFPYEALLHAKDDMMTVPGLGNLNTVFVLSIGFGMIMILVNILFGIYNSVRQHDLENIFFSQNALAGLVFYGSIVLMLFLVMSGRMTMQAILPIILVPIVLSLIVIFLKDLLTRALRHRQPVLEGGPMFFVQAFFETFEVILSYLSNTLSYVRIGAYAVSHVAMMEVVMMLAGAEGGSGGNLLVIILGNAFVAAMEALMVGIQVLRLEYYEMFSRFYKGGGREFTPFRKKTR